MRLCLGECFVYMVCLYVLFIQVKGGWLRFLRVSGLMLSFTLVSVRSAARLQDLTLKGTVFVLLKALEIKEIDLDEFLEVFD